MTRLALFVALAGLACTGASTPADDTGTGTDTDGTSEPGAPRILQLSSNTTVLDDESTLVISAVVTDADGIEDVIGGSLTDASGASYGSFETAAGEGAYEKTLDWRAIDTVAPIWLGESAERELTATFFDASGNETSQQLSVGLTCASDNASTCEDSGECLEMDTFEHCRSCGNRCDATRDMPSVQAEWTLPYTEECGDSGCEYHLMLERRHPEGATCADACAPVPCTKAIDSLNDEAPCTAPVSYNWECLCAQ